MVLLSAVGAKTRECGLYFLFSEKTVVGIVVAGLQHYIMKRPFFSFTKTTLLKYQPDISRVEKSCSNDCSIMYQSSHSKAVPGKLIFVHGLLHPPGTFYFS